MKCVALQCTCARGSRVVNCMGCVVTDMSFVWLEETCWVTCVQMIMSYSVDALLCIVGKVICLIGAFWSVAALCCSSLYAEKETYVGIMP
jgi:hypothetical protein